MIKKLVLTLSAAMMALSINTGVSAHPDDPDLPVIYSKVAKEQSCAIKDNSSKSVKPQILQRSVVPDDPDLPV